MPRQLHKLTALNVAKAKKVNSRLSDGGNLYLRISKTGVKSWSFMYVVDGAQREIGLGPLHPKKLSGEPTTVTLAEAREKAAHLRKLLAAGIDPMAQKSKERLERIKKISFEAAAKEFIENKRAGWKNAKHAAQWAASLEAYAYPTIGKVSVAEIDTLLVLRCLQPIWETKTETATRVRSRIENILDWAKVKGYRSGDNPARWQGHLQHTLAAPQEVASKQHYPALPYERMSEFLRDLRGRNGVSARALEFAILTASRVGPVRSATWAQVDEEEDMWITPAVSMKGKRSQAREHRTPLSTRLKEILSSLPRAGGDSLIFPSQSGRSLSDAALNKMIRDMSESRVKNGEAPWIDPKCNRVVVAHGFRSSFKDWAAEETSYPAEMSEMALAHAVSDKVEAAYRRGDLLKKRRQMMEDWSNWSDPQRAGNVIPMSAKVKSL